MEKKITRAVLKILLLPSPLAKVTTFCQRDSLLISTSRWSFHHFSVRPTVQTDSHTVGSVSTMSIQRPASADAEPYSSPCVDPHIVNTHQLNLNGQGLAKPNYSYTHLIFMAIESTPQKCMTVNQIYNCVRTNFPFYKQAGAGWKNSLRHNLSINKSFKRLPRDSRGPGRGAFWTVEPRERPTLMDAIKRNPWNFANMAALVSGQCEQNTNFSVFGMRRFGLTQSAPGQVLRAVGFGNADFMDSHSDVQNNTVHLPSGGIRLVPTLDGRFIATRDGHLQHLDIGGPPSSDGSLSGTSHPGSLVLPDSRYWLPPEASTSDAGAGIEVEWSAEEEEKYARTLQLLIESADRGSQTAPNLVSCADGSDSNKPQSNEGVTSADEMKLCTKQRRKSRLQPTRIVEDMYPYSFSLMGKCNECKENAAAGCDSCLAKRRRFLSTSVSANSINDHTFLDVANCLDSDQECGPAGGPIIRKQNPTGTKTNFESEVENDGIETHETSEEVADEVYVTPAPYIDHEYSHCHAQLRRPEEIRLVNNFNELYCADALRRLSKGRLFSKRNEVYTRSRLCLNPYDESEAEYDDAADETFSSQDQATYSDEYSDISDFGEFRSEEMSDISECQRGRRVSRGSFRTLAPRLVDNAFRSRDGTRRRLGKHSSRARGRRRFAVVCHTSSPGTGVTRRSKRVIRAPKRPYDDFEDPFLIEGEELNVFDAKTDEKADGTCSMSIQTGNATQNHPQTQLGLEDVNCGGSPVRPIRGRRGRKKGRRQGRRPNSMHTSRNFESNDSFMTSEQFDSTSDEDEELRYLRMARRRQRMSEVERDEISSTTSGSQNSHSSTKDYKNRVSEMPHRITSECSLPGSNGTRTTPLGISAVWGQSRWAIAQKFSAQSWPDCAEADLEPYDALEESASGIEANAEDLEECDVEEIRQPEPSKPGERTTVEAAQLLLGISQMQSFRRQSGYLSLDSSGTSASLTIDASESTKDTTRDSPKMLSMTSTVLLDRHNDS
ncbi:Forkhead box protein N3 [Fasciola gigantica]|uniref:Forkhead box protein N3 n=1 Tax=Fasciola gigantica TaxID=46835 RepID=A0A504Z8Y7_FASGI|nr:Forkhead box protein N3 [Fasciola gigantica]